MFFWSAGTVPAAVTVNFFRLREAVPPLTFAKISIVFGIALFFGRLCPAKEKNGGGLSVTICRHRYVSAGRAFPCRPCPSVRPAYVCSDFLDVYEYKVSGGCCRVERQLVEEGMRA